MKILIPGKPNINPFFEEIIERSTHEFIYEDFFNANFHSFDALLIHWPEQIFNWHEPGKNQLLELEKKLKEWSKIKPIIYVIHNEKSHLGKTQNYESLYFIIEKFAHSLLHLGNYSLKKYLKKFPDKKHRLLPHPLYRKNSSNLTKSRARSNLNLSHKDYVMLIPGKIRTKIERQLAIKAFKLLPVKNKVLIAPIMYKYTLGDNFPGRYKLKKLIDLKVVYEKLLEYLNRRKNRKYGYSSLSHREMMEMVMAADLIFIPRYNSLNSGILYLAMTFKKPVVGPAIGNIQEVLEELKFPAFKSHSLQSVKYALKKAVNLQDQSFYYSEKFMSKYKIENVVGLWDDCLEEIIK